VFERRRRRQKGITTFALLVLMMALVSCTKSLVQKPEQQDLPVQAVSIIQNLIDSVPVGAQVVLPEGRFRGTLVVNKKAIVLGNKTILEAPDEQTPALIVCAPGASLSGLQVKASRDRPQKPSYGVVLRADNIVFSDSQLTGTSLRLEGSKNNTVQSLRIQGYPDLPIDERLDGIRVVQGGGHIFKNLHISDAADGVYFDHVGSAAIDHISIQGSRYGFHLMFSKNLTFDANRSFGNVVGMMVMDQDGLVLQDNHFYNNRTAHSVGLVLYETRNASISGNIIENNTTGLQISGTDVVRLNGNVVQSNATAVLSSGLLKHTTFTRNRFVGNLVGVNATHWDTAPWHEGEQGNYWDDYQGFDLDGNKIGDSPERSGSYQAQVYLKEPLLGLFYGSPLSQVLDTLSTLGHPVDPVPRLK